MLVMTLMTEAEPIGPTLKMRRPIASKAARCVSNRSASPPTMTVISPLAARCTPPVTGVSSVRTPKVFARSERRRIVSRSLVLISIQVRPGLAVFRICSSTFSEAVGEGRQVMIASTCIPISAGLSPHFAPAASSGSAWTRFMSLTVRSKPSRTRLPASLAPRLPRPMKP